MNGENQIDVVIYFKRKVPKDVGGKAGYDYALIARIDAEDFVVSPTCLMVVTRDEDDDSVVETNGYPLSNVLRWSVEPCTNH